MKLINCLKLSLTVTQAISSPTLLTWVLLPLLMFSSRTQGLFAQLTPKSVDDSLASERIQLQERSALQLPANIKLLDQTQENFFRQLDNWDSIPDEIIQRYIFTLADRAVILENQIITDYQKNAYHLSLLRENLVVFSKNKKENKGLIEQTKTEIATVKELDNKLASVRKKAKTLTTKIINISKLEVTEIRSQLTAAQEAFATLNEIAENEDLELDLASFAKAKQDNLTYSREETHNTPANTPQKNQETLPEPTPNAPEPPTTTNHVELEPTTTPTNAKQYAKYKPEADVMLFPPKSPCAFARQGTDEFSGEKVTQLKPEVLFQYTNDFLKQYIKDKAHITGNTYISRLGALTFLHIDFVIQEANTKVGFGALSQNAIVTLKFVNGATITLYNQKSDSGTVDPTNTFTTYEGQFLLDKNALVAIAAKELDKIRVNWSTGFEDYPIYNVDALMRQLDCTNNIDKK